MPTDTFFRLPEEKRTRILEGAWSEFTAVPYAEASINRIVQTSRSMIRSSARAETFLPCRLRCSTQWSPRAAASRRRFPALSRC